MEGASRPTFAVASACVTSEGLLLGAIPVSGVHLAPLSMAVRFLPALKFAAETSAVALLAEAMTPLSTVRASAGTLWIAVMSAVVSPLASPLARWALATWHLADSMSKRPSTSLKYMSLSSQQLPLSSAPPSSGPNPKLAPAAGKRARPPSGKLATRARGVGACGATAPTTPSLEKLDAQSSALSTSSRPNGSSAPDGPRPSDGERDAEAPRGDEDDELTVTGWAMGQGAPPSSTVVTRRAFNTAGAKAGSKFDALADFSAGLSMQVVPRPAAKVLAAASCPRTSSEHGDHDLGDSGRWGLRNATVSAARRRRRRGLEPSSFGQRRRRRHPREVTARLPLSSSDASCPASALSEAGDQWAGDVGDGEAKCAGEGGNQRGSPVFRLRPTALPLRRLLWPPLRLPPRPLWLRRLCVRLRGLAREWGLRVGPIHSYRNSLRIHARCDT